MRGIDEARAFYREYGEKMLRDRFPDHAGRIAVGLAGRGSECWGYDDALSRDHDFEGGFCLWLTAEDEETIGLALSRAYRELPFCRTEAHSALAHRNRGPMAMGDFFRRYTGTDGAPTHWQQWLALPSHALAEAVNGEVWRDDLGAFTRIREEIRRGMPEDVRKKKLAARAVEMAQSGQYNYARCLRRGEPGAAMLALNEFVKSTCSMIYLLNREHMPYYKWCLRGMERLPLLAAMREPLEFLLTGDNDAAGQRLKQQVLEEICLQVIKELQAQGLSQGSWDYLEPHGFRILEGIENAQIRALHILEGEI